MRSTRSFNNYILHSEWPKLLRAPASLSGIWLDECVVRHHVQILNHFIEVKNKRMCIECKIKQFSSMISSLV